MYNFHVTDNCGVTRPAHFTCTLICDADGNAVTDHAGRQVALTDEREVSITAALLGVKNPSYRYISLREFRTTYPEGYVW